MAKTSAGPRTAGRARRARPRSGSRGPRRGAAPRGTHRASHRDAAAAGRDLNLASCAAMSRQSDKAERFRALHVGDPFVIPNPWDAGSARMFEALGFEALATTSSGFAFTLGRLDVGVTLDEVIAHAAALDGASGLPVSVDLENGCGAAPDE